MHGNTMASTALCEGFKGCYTGVCSHKNLEEVVDRESNPEYGSPADDSFGGSSGSSAVPVKGISMAHPLRTPKMTSRQHQDIWEPAMASPQAAGHGEGSDGTPEYFDGEEEPDLSTSHFGQARVPVAAVAGGESQATSAWRSLGTRPRAESGMSGRSARGQLQDGGGVASLTSSTVSPASEQRSCRALMPQAYDYGGPQFYESGEECPPCCVVLSCLDPCLETAERMLASFAAVASKLAQAADKGVLSFVQPLNEAAPFRYGCCLVLFLLIAFIVGISSMRDVTLDLPTNVPWTRWAEDVDIHIANVSANDPVEVMLELRNNNVAVIAEFELALVYVLNHRPESDGEWNKAFWEAAAIEKQLRQLSGWKRLCSRADANMQKLCEPGVSLPSLALPTLNWDAQSVMPNSLALDGGGSNALSVESAVHLAKLHGQDSIVLPSQVFQNSSGAALSSMDSFRSYFRFPLEVCKVLDDGETQLQRLADAKAEWREFVESELLPELENIKSRTKAWPFQIWFVGNDLESEQLHTMIDEDIWTIVPWSLAILWCCHVIYMHSFFLGTLGAMILSFSAALAIWIVHDLGISSLFLMFAVTGLGSSIVFACMDAWHATKQDSNRLVQSSKAMFRFPLGAVVFLCFMLFAALASGYDGLKQQAYHLVFWAILLWLQLFFIFIPACALHERFPVRSFQFLKDLIQHGWKTIAGGQAESSNDNDVDWAKTLAALEQRMLKELERVAHFKCKVFFLMVLLLTTIILLIVMAASVEATPDALGVVPNDHNLLGYGSALAMFETKPPLSDQNALLATEQDLCSPEKSPQDSTCDLGWCFIGQPEDIPFQYSRDACTCQRRDYCDGQLRTQMVRIVQEDSSYSRPEAVAEALGRQRIGGNSVAESIFTMHRLPDVILNDWQAGTGKFAQVWAAQHVEMLACNSSRPSSSEICYCSLSACSALSGFRWVSGVSTSQLDAAINAAEAGGGASTDGGSAPTEEPETAPTTTSERWRSEWPWTVQVVLGFTNPGSSSQALFASPRLISGFEPRELDAQRGLLRLCMEAPESLLVTSRSCWLDDFRDWLYGEGQQYRYPTFPEDFHRLASTFLVNRSAANLHYVWLEDNHVNGFFIEFQVGLPKNASTDDIRVYKNLWDSYVRAWSSTVPGSVRSVWHTSKLWEALNAGAEDVAEAGNEEEESLSGEGAFFVALLFLVIVSLPCACELLLVSGVLLSALLVTSCLAIFLEDEVGRALGLVEVSLLAIGFVHACVTCLHAVGHQLHWDGKGFFVQGWSFFWSGCTGLLCAIPYFFAELPMWELAFKVTLFTTIMSGVFCVVPVLLLRASKRPPSSSDAPRLDIGEGSPSSKGTAEAQPPQPGIHEIRPTSDTGDEHGK